MAKPVGRFELHVPEKANPPIVAMGHAPVATQMYFVTHNWADKTSWYPNSAQATDEVASRDGTDGRIYHLSKSDLIDVSHGKVFYEDLALFDPYRVGVKVDTVVQTENSIDSAAWPSGDGDYEVDYVAGDIKFNSDPGAGANVEVSYSHLDTGISAGGPSGQSVFSIKPATGKQIRIVKAEVQFSKDLELNDSMIFAAFAGGFEIPGTRVSYKVFQDYLNEATGNYPIIPSGFGGTGVRGLNQDLLQIPWNWVGSKLLKDSDNAELRIWLENGNEHGGTWATATLYTMEHDE